MIQTVLQCSRTTISKSPFKMENLFPLTGLSNYVSKIKQRCLSMCGPRVCVCLINFSSFGWRFSSGLNLEHSQQQSQSLSAGMLLLEQGSQTSSREIRRGREGSCGSGTRRRGCREVLSLGFVGKTVS